MAKIKEKSEKDYMSISWLVLKQLHMLDFEVIAALWALMRS